MGVETPSTELAVAPAGFDQSDEVFARVTRLATALFAPAIAHVTLHVDGAVWRSNDPHGQMVGEPIVARWVAAHREPLWVPDAREDPRFRDHPFVTGEHRLRLIVAAPIRLPDGSIPGAVTIGSKRPRSYDPELAARAQDLADLVANEWRRASATRAHEASSQESQNVRQILGSIIENAPLSLLMLDTELRILAASRMWLNSRRLKRREAYGLPLYEVMPQARSWELGLTRCLEGETIQSDRGKVLRPDGSVSWVRAELSPWRRSTGEVGGVLLSAHDITDMIETLERLERSEERMKLAMEIADVHVWEMDYVRRELIKAGAEDTFFDKPKTYEDLFSDIWSTIDARDRAAVREAWARHERGEEGYRPEYRTHRADGREVWATGSVRMLYDREGKPVRMVGAIQDITSRKRTEQALLAAKEDAEAATRAKSAFLATMSHEIRTPLNGVLGMAQAMARDELAPGQRERLDVIRQSGEALLAILNDVLDLSKIEAGKLELEQTEFDIAELARSAHATFAATAQAKGLDFRLTVTPGARGVYVGDTVRVRQILYNLVSNALKFTERGAVRVTVGRQRGRLTLTVADTGIGIAPQKLASLFQKFEQADASTTRRYGGTGLGLAICRDLAEMMGGAIEARSEEGEGTTFSVTLPLPKTARTAPKKKPRKTREPKLLPGARALRVLAAEDNGMNQLVLKTLLAQIGIEPTIVADGRAAVGAWESGAWDLILMDVQMPEMDGPTATGIIRAREATEGRTRTRIIALTANAMDHQVSEYRAAGMDDFVAKPIEAGRLYEAVLAAAEPVESPAKKSAA